MENNNNKLTKVTAEWRAYKEAKKIYEETPEYKIYEKDIFPFGIAACNGFWCFGSKHHRPHAPESAK